MTCKICQSESILLFSKKILGKYDSGFYKCSNCGFIQTDEPIWLAEAYQDAISDMDTGIFVRNVKFQKIVPIIIKTYFNLKAKLLDYGAGYGIFVRMMRDKGFDFWWQDEYCANLFAKNYDAKSLSAGEQRFELVTAFEVFEHLTDPVAEVEKMLKYTDSILFSTNLIPNFSPLTPHLESWWYLSPETGQHIAIYSEKSLEILGDKFGLNLYTNGKNFHLLTRKKINPFIFTGLKAMKTLQGLIKKENDGSQVDRDAYKLK
jgi:hypothetical protein